MKYVILPYLTFVTIYAIQQIIFNYLQINVKLLIFCIKTFIAVLIVGQLSKNSKTILTFRDYLNIKGIKCIIIYVLFVWYIKIVIYSKSTE